MKKLLNLLLAIAAIVGVACTPNNEGNGGENNGPKPALTFTVQLSNITSSSVYMAVTPSNNTDTYFFDVVPQYVMAHYDTPEAFATDYVSQLISLYEQYDLVFADVLSKGADAWQYEQGNLEINTEYYAIVFGVTAEGVVTSEVTMESFKTLELEKSDKAFNNLSYGYCTNYGDYYESNAANWYIDLYPEEGMDMLILEVQTPLDATDFTGNYPLASTFDAGTAVAGFIDSESYICGSYWCTLNSSYEIADYAFCNTGNVAISKSGEDYTIVVDAVDPDGYKITANYTGTIEEYTDGSASTLSTKKGMARRFRFIPKDRNTKVAQPLCRNAMVKLRVEGGGSIAPNKTVSRSRQIG